MATKTNLLSAINAQLTAVITQVKHRLSMSLLVDELFVQPTEESETNQGVFQLLDSNFNFRIKYSKKGNTVFVNGYIENNSSSIFSNPNILEITNSEYYQIPFVDYSQNYKAPTSKENVVVSFMFDNTISLLGTIGVGDVVFFNFTYNTNL